MKDLPGLVPVCAGPRQGPTLGRPAPAWLPARGGDGLSRARAGRGRAHGTEALRRRLGGHAPGRAVEQSRWVKATKMKGWRAERPRFVPSGDITCVAGCNTFRDALTFPPFTDYATAALAVISPLQFLYSGMW